MDVPRVAGVGMASRLIFAQAVCCRARVCRAAFQNPEANYQSVNRSRCRSPFIASMTSAKMRDEILFGRLLHKRQFGCFALFANANTAGTDVGYFAAIG